MFSHINVEPPRPSEVTDQAIPKDLEGVILRALRKDPEERYGDATLFSVALSRCRHFGKWRPAPGMSRPEAPSGVVSMTPSGDTTRVDLRGPDAVLDEVAGPRPKAALLTPRP